MTTPTFTAASSTRTVKSSITGLESSVSAILSHLGEHVVGDLAVDLELEALALADVGHAREAEPGQGAEHGLALRVEDLGLGHDVDDDSGHGAPWYGGIRREVYAWPGRRSGWIAGCSAGDRALVARSVAPARHGRLVHMSHVLPRRPDARPLAAQLEFPQSLAVYDDYAAAQKAVDFLADNKFPVEQCMIVGTDLKRIERITGRLTTARVAARRRALRCLARPVRRADLRVLHRGARLVIVVSDGRSSARVFGLIWALVGYAATRGQRDFSSVTQVVATRYEVLVEHKVAAQARELLAQLPGGAPDPFA